MKTVKGGVTAPKGFSANSINCGIKRSKPDLALLLSETPATACGVFTQNKIKGAPIIVSQHHIKNPTCRGIIVNSGNANCCNGTKGMEAALTMAALVAKVLKVSPSQILVASTGLIGEPFPISPIKKAIPDLIKGLNKRKNSSFVKAIMTTDKFPKEVAIKIRVGGSVVTIGGVAKGAGMIHPNMATMLSFVTTDAVIKKDVLRDLFKKAVEKSFNSISVDGATSTNDCAFILANGLANNRTIGKGGSDYNKFYKALEYVMAELAKKIVLDGEGATKFIHIIVRNAKSHKDAKRVAISVANNPLFKTSAYGEDPNWGRVAQAVGSSGVDFIPAKLDISLGNKRVLRGGTRVEVGKKILKKIYKKRNIRIFIDLKLGKKHAEVLTCDLSKKYVDINAHYT